MSQPQIVIDELPAGMSEGINLDELVEAGLSRPRPLCTQHLSQLDGSSGLTVAELFTTTATLLVQARGPEGPLMEEETHAQH